MKYLSMPATLLMFSTIVFAPAHASTANSVVQNVNATAVSSQVGKTMEAVLAELAIKHNKEIAALGLSDEQLNALVYVRPDWIREPIPFSTVKEFAAVLFAQPNLQSVKMEKYGEYIGFLVEITGLPSDGYALYPQEKSYLLKGVVDGEGLLETTDAREEELLFQLFYPKVMTVLTENGFKG